MSSPVPKDPTAESARRALAVAWLTEHIDDCPRPIIPYVKQAYGLGNLDAIEAVKLARQKRGAGA